MGSTRATNSFPTDKLEAPTPDVPDQTFFGWHSEPAAEGSDREDRTWLRSPVSQRTLRFDWLSRPPSPERPRA